MATLEQRSGSWRVNWRLGGRRNGARQSATFTGDPDAAEKLARAAKQLVESRAHAATREEIYAAVLGPGRPATGSVTLAEWAPRWLKTKDDTGEVQPDTVARYRQILHRWVLPRLGHLPLPAIDRDQISGWVAWLANEHRRRDGRKLSAKTVRRAHAVLHQALGAAVVAGHLQVNPAARPAGARRHATGLPKVTAFEGMFLEPWEVEAVLAHASDQIRDLAFVLVRTGLRLGEILVLRVQDVHLSGKRPHVAVRRALKTDGSIGDPKSAKSRREVTVSREAVTVLAPRVSGKRRDALIFPAPKGGVWSENNLRQRHWLPAVAAAQRCAEHPPPLPAKPARGPTRKLRPDEVSTCTCPGRLLRTPRMHDLRHTHVSLLVEAGWTPKRVQLRVGHANYQVTMDIYGHLWERDDADRLDAMEALLAMADDEVA